MITFRGKNVCSCQTVSVRSLKQHIWLHTNRNSSAHILIKLNLTKTINEASAINFKALYSKWYLRSFKHSPLQSQATFPSIINLISCLNDINSLSPSLGLIKDWNPIFVQRHLLDFRTKLIIGKHTHFSSSWLYGSVKVMSIKIIEYLWNRELVAFRLIKDIMENEYFSSS